MSIIGLIGNQGIILSSCYWIQVSCVCGTFDICVITLNPITLKTRPTFGSLRELCLIYNKEMLLQWDGLESTPRRASQAEEVVLYIFYVYHVCACGQWVLQVGQGRAGGAVCTDKKELNFLSDLGHVQGSGHFLQLCLHCAVAEGSLQNRLFDSQELTHLFQICKCTTNTCCTMEKKAKTLVIVCKDWTQSWGQEENESKS